MTISGKVIERLSLYRRLMTNAFESGEVSMYSHDLAEKAGVTAAQVRRDLMEIGFAGTSKKGYEVSGLKKAIADYLDNPDGEKVALIGVGNLGRALLPFFAAHEPNVRINAAFDTDPFKTGRVIHGCRVYPDNELDKVIKEQDINVAILAVPAEYAQSVTARLLNAGICGIMNFAPVTLKVPEYVTV
ncbi:MAG: redox-sensing transcriptional repressor Rex, partial [Planctomycetota bacterium]